MKSFEGRRLAEKYSRQSLVAQISSCHQRIRRLKQSEASLQLELEELLPVEVYEKLVALKEQVFRDVSSTCKERQKAKFDKLLEDCCHNKCSSDVKKRWVLNLSNTQLSTEETEVLKKGLNFAPAPHKIPVSQMISAVECGLSRIPSEAAFLARKKVANILSHAKPPESNLRPEHCRALKSLKRKTNILILPADKGRATVVMDKEDYERKVCDLLDDSRTYEVLKRDPTVSFERKMNALLLEYKKRGLIPQRLYDRLRSSGGLTPLFYGLPKIHKPGVPLRPIVSFITSPSYQLSRHLSYILSPLIGKSDSSVKNSVEFSDFIRSKHLGQDEVLVSFDVVSLFTNVPISLAIEVARRRLETDEELCLRTQLGTQELITLLEFCLKATYLAFRGRVFRQKFGTAMGSPVSVSVANLVMEDIEERALTSFNIQLPFWKRYVDDTITAVPKEKVSELLDHLNSIEDSINFTVEIEKNSKIPFLDILLTHEADGSVSTTVYRKATHTDKYLDYESHHPLSHKLSVVSTLLHRIDTHCSTDSARSVENSRVLQALKVNGYPKTLVRRPPVKKKHQLTQEWKSTIVLPYVRGVSESLRRVLGPLGVRVGFRPANTLGRMLSRPKDVIPDVQKSGVVYKIPCASCPASYIGQTGRRLQQRLDEHKRAIRQADFNASPLAEHVWTEEHQVDWSNVVVVSNPRDLTTRLVEEALTIRSTTNVLNRDTGFLPSGYDGLR